MAYGGSTSPPDSCLWVHEVYQAFLAFAGVRWVGGEQMPGNPDSRTVESTGRRFLAILEMMHNNAVTHQRHVGNAGDPDV